MDIRDLVAELIAKFPRHGKEIAAWAPEYARALDGADMRTSLVATMQRWQKGYPPKPAEMVRRQAGLVTYDGGGALELPETKTNPDGSRSCTRKGFERARAIKRRIMDDMLRCAPLELTPGVATYLAREHDAEAWLLAQHQVLDGQLRSIDLTEREITLATEAEKRDWQPTPECTAFLREY